MVVTSQYACTFTPQTTSTGTLLADGLSFGAQYWRVFNDGSVGLRLALDSSAGTTANAHEVRAGESPEFRCFSARYSVLTTSTSTDGVDVREFRIVALGG